MNDLDKLTNDAFDEGARYVLNDLADVFEGVEDTDVWQDFFGESEETHDETVY